MSEELKPCPFCAGKPEIHTQMVSRYQFVSCSRCRCDGPLKERTRDAIAAWNRRAFPSAEGDAREAAKRIVDWDDAGRLADDEWLVERNETAIIAICRALLSTPVDARREALEEAAKVADEAQASAREEVESDKKEMGEDYDPYSFGAGFLSGEITASINIATAIRALSPPVKDTP